MTLDEAIRVDWAVLTGKKSVGVEKFAIEHTTYFALLAQHGEHIPVIVDADQQFYEKEGNEVLTAKETVSLLMDTYLEDITKQMQWGKTDETGTYVVFTLDFNLPAGTYFTDTLGNHFVMSGLRVLGCRTECCVTMCSKQGEMNARRAHLVDFI
jgi:hypothetical protein